MASDPRKRTRLVAAAVGAFVVVGLFTLGHRRRFNMQVSQPWTVGADVCGWRGIPDVIDTLLLPSSSFSTVCPPALLSEMLELTVETSRVALEPAEVRDMVRGWLGDRADRLLPLVERQRLLHVRSRWEAGAETALNPLRAARPLPRTPLQPAEFAAHFMNRTAGAGCDFCRFRQRTAADAVTGRLETPLAATSANIFKVHSAHALVFPKRHDLPALTLAETTDLFRLAERWARAHHAAHHDRTHLHMIFDALEKAGASQAHPHLHLLMGRGRHLGEFYALRAAAAGYNNGDYLWSWVQAHLDAGLGALVGDVAVVAPLDARKDHELMVVAAANGGADGELMSQNWIRAVHGVYSSGYAFPSLEESQRHESLPAMARIGSRGNCQSPVSDVSSFDLYLLDNVNTDPFHTIAAFRRTLQKLEAAGWT